MADMSTTDHDSKQADLAIGAHARSLREARGLSLRDVANLAREMKIEGLTFSRISELETGRRRWSTMYASRIARVLGVGTHDVLIGAVLNQPPIAQPCTVAGAAG